MILQPGKVHLFNVAGVTGHCWGRRHGPGGAAPATDSPRHAHPPGAPRTPETDSWLRRQNKSGWLDESPSEADSSELTQMACFGATEQITTFYHRHALLEPLMMRRRCTKLHDCAQARFAETQTNVNRRGAGLRVLRTHLCSCKTQPRPYFYKSSTFSPWPGGTTAVRAALSIRKPVILNQDPVCSPRTSNPSLILIISHRRFSKSGIREMQQLF